MNVEQLRGKLEDEMEGLKNAALSENDATSENILIGQHRMCQRVIDWIDQTYSNEEEQ